VIELDLERLAAAVILQASRDSACSNETIARPARAWLRDGRRDLEIGATPAGFDPRAIRRTVRSARVQA
jgi:hypothetical protein